MNTRALKETKGITIIALIITIIILLILVIVSIHILKGDIGLLTKTETAKNKFAYAQAKEKVMLL